MKSHGNYFDVSKGPRRIRLYETIRSLTKKFLDISTPRGNKQKNLLFRNYLKVVSSACFFFFFLFFASRYQATKNDIEFPGESVKCDARLIEGSMRARTVHDILF